MKNYVVLIAELLCVLGCFSASAAPGDENWDSRFGLPPGLDGTAYSMATLGRNLYVAGDFTHVGALNVNGVACWDGQRWSAVLTNSDFSGFVYTLATDGKNLIVGGAFEIPSLRATNIVRWNGTAWDALGGGVRQECGGRVGVFSLAAKGNVIYAGGAFSRAGSSGATNVAVWDGRAWSALGAGLGGTCFDQPYGIVNALLISGNSLYAGGTFHNSGSFPVTNLAVWNGRSWNGVGGGISGGSSFSVIQDGVAVEYSGGVLALYASKSGLYVGGYFTRAGSSSATNIALWNGKTWNNLGGGVGFGSTSGGAVDAIIASQRGIAVGGIFDRAGSVAANSVARWNGSAWTAIGAGFRGRVYALGVSDTLYAGGDFGLSGPTQIPFIGRLAGDQWTPLQPGTGNAVIGFIAGVTAAHGKAYLFGNLTSAGSLPVENVAGWDGSAWNDVGGGIAAFVYEGVVARSNLYVHGSFQLPAIGATNVACWNGQNWAGLPHAEELGVNALSRIYRMAGDDTHLYLRIYPNADSSAPPLFAWNGQQWTGLGAPFQGSIDYITASEGHLYVFGSFDHIGGVAATNIAQWNGQNWQALGGSLSELGFQNSSIQLGATSGERLYVLATDTAQAGRSCLACWNGASWRSLLEGTYLPINSLAATESNLYVGGYFNALDGVAANYIARFDGLNWSGLGSGLNGPPDYRTIAADDSNVYVSGRFSTAGGKSSYHFGIWHEP